MQRLWHIQVQAVQWMAWDEQQEVRWKSGRDFILRTLCTLLKTLRVILRWWELLSYPSKR